MTLEEIELLNIGDLVEDLELPKQIAYEGRIICRVVGIDENRITINSLESKFGKSYPYTFSISKLENFKKI